MIPASKWHFVLGLPNESPEIPKLGTPTTLGAHNFLCRPQIEMRLKKNCSPCRELCNGMWHTTCTQGNRGDFRILVVGSQIVNSTPNPSFGHNLCFRCPNGSCKPILDIYVSRAFLWYNERLNPMGFDPCNRSLKIWEFTETLIPKVGASLGVWGFIPSHSPTLLGAWDVTLGLLFWPAPLQALVLVVNPRVGLWHYVAMMVEDKL